MNIQVEISIGEFLDKLTILQIKSERISDSAKLANIQKELGFLQNIWDRFSDKTPEITALVNKLKEVNETLWDIEDDIRIKESQNSFDEEFIGLARSVYLTNDERAQIKRELATLLGSGFIEEKSYADYSSNKPK